jgi:arylsulfatase A-like enzyme
VPSQQILQICVYPFSGAAQLHMALSKPNVLLIHADQHRADCIAANGHPLIQTPHLDRLAQEGINFIQAFCPIPLCTPARASLLTGVWPGQHGSITNHGAEAGRPFDSRLPTFSQILRKAGYFLGYVGKWGVDSHHDPTHYGFHAYIAEKDYVRWREGQGLPPRPNKNGWFGETDTAITPAQSRPAWTANQAIELLRYAARRAKPFFIRWDPSEPHLPNVVPEPYASLYPPAQIAPWHNFADALADKPYIQRQQRRTWGIEGWTWEQWGPVVSRYLGEVTLLDHQVGRLLVELDELGLAENTVVFYTADHGDLCGGHGMIDKHFVMYDELVRVPLLVRWPAQIRPGRRSEAFIIHSLDLAATFCELAGVAIPRSFAGRSLLPLLRQDDAGMDQGWRQDIFATYYGNQFGLYSQRMVRNRRWKYVWNATAEDELYDLASDPGELTNLAAAPAQDQPLVLMRQRLVHWMEQTQDSLLNGWTRSQLLSGAK